MRFFMNSAEPLTQNRLWNGFTPRQPRAIRAICDSYPFLFERRKLMARALSGDHASAIEYHYDVSNEFYKLFVDRSMYPCQTPRS